MRIWKFPIPLGQIKNDEPISLAMPSFADVLDVQAQGEAICLWALVDPDAMKIERHFRVVGTGFTVPYPVGDYLGTVQFYGGSLVLHVFEFTP